MEKNTFIVNERFYVSNVTLSLVSSSLPELRLVIFLWILNTEKDYQQIYYVSDTAPAVGVNVNIFGRLNIIVWLTAAAGGRSKSINSI